MKKRSFMNRYPISAAYSDITSGISSEERKGFFEKFGEILDCRVENIIIHKDSLIRPGVDLLKHLFRKFGT